MTDTNTPENSNQMSAAATPVVVHAQYIKDLSFENPNAPQSLMPGAKGPDMDININLGARDIKDEQLKDLYEVTLTLTAKATREDSAVFVAEISYGALTSLQGLPENQHHPILFIEVPKLIFPFARQVLSDLTASGGYPPLLLNPAAFHATYLERFSKEIEASKNESAKNGKAA